MRLPLLPAYTPPPLRLPIDASTPSTQTPSTPLSSARPTLAAFGPAEGAVSADARVTLGRAPLLRRSQVALVGQFLRRLITGWRNHRFEHGVCVPACASMDMSAVIFFVLLQCLAPVFCYFAVTCAV